MYFSAAATRGNRGAIKGGRLNDAKIVMLSRIAKRAYVTGGMGLADTVPNIFVNCESLIMVRLKFAALVAANFAGPAVIVLAALLRVVDLKVSRMFADRYVPPYTIRIKPNVFDVRYK